MPNNFEYLIDADNFEEYRAVALRNLSKVLLNTCKIECYPKCINGGQLLATIELALSETEKRIIEFHFAINGIKKTQVQIGQMVRLSGPTISRKQMIAIEKLAKYNKFYYIPLSKKIGKMQQLSLKDYTPIEYCEFSADVYNSLKNYGILTLQEFSHMTLDEQRSIDTLSTRCLVELHNYCSLHGLPEHQ